MWLACHVALPLLHQMAVFIVQVPQEEFTFFHQSLLFFDMRPTIFILTRLQIRRGKRDNLGIRLFSILLI